eukprot:364109-Chlamydomonas_euryale.AAC.7
MSLDIQASKCIPACVCAASYKLRLLKRASAVASRDATASFKAKFPALLQTSVWAVVHVRLSRLQGIVVPMLLVTRGVQC